MDVNDGVPTMKHTADYPVPVRSRPLRIPASHGQSGKKVGRHLPVGKPDPPYIPGWLPISCTPPASLCFRRAPCLAHHLRVSRRTRRGRRARRTATDWELRSHSRTVPSLTHWTSLPVRLVFPQDAPHPDNERSNPQKAVPRALRHLRALRDIRRRSDPHGARRKRTDVSRPPPAPADHRTPRTKPPPPPPTAARDSTPSSRAACSPPDSRTHPRASSGSRSARIPSA